MLAPRIFEVGPAFESMPEDEEAVYAVAAVVTREGRVSNYELLQSVRKPVADQPGVSPMDEVTAVLDAVRHSRFEPAQTADGVVAVNMVWVLARTTVKASAKPDESDNDSLNVARARPAAPRPARS